MGVDGRGHLYAVLYPTPEDRAAGRLAVDVYSQSGDRLFAGWMPNRFSDAVAADGWITAWSDYVYGLGNDQVHGEATMVRYRLVTPF